MIKGIGQTEKSWKEVIGTRIALVLKVLLDRRNFFIVPIPITGSAASVFCLFF